MSKKRRNWKVVDWSLSTAEIAEMMGTSKQVVSNMRSYHAPETLRGYSGSKDWVNKYDWSLSNSELAEIHGTTRFDLYVKRKRFAPHTMVKRKIDWDMVDWRRDTKDIAKSLNKSPSTVMAKRRKHAPSTAPRRIDWLGVDWDKTTDQIAYELDICKTQVSRARQRFAPDSMMFIRKDSPLLKEKVEEVEDETNEQ